MFDVGWSEILLIGAVAVVAIGPEEIPQVMKSAARVVRRLQYVRFALSQQFEEIIKEAGVEDFSKVNFEAPQAEYDEKASDEEEIKKTENVIASDQRERSNPE